MSNETLFEFEAEKTGREAATLLRELADGLDEGTAIELAAEDQSVTVDAPEDLTVEIELERETGSDRLELEVELEWTAPADESAALDEGSADSTDRGPDAESGDRGGGGAETTEESAEPAVDAEIASRGGPTSMARFQVFRDRADEWRWRLVHRNGNVIATSGEGYTRRRNAEKGLRSVVTNAPEADVEDA